MWSDIPPDLYEGVGDQWDVYRLMRDHTDDEWTEFYPSTNIIVSPSTQTGHQLI